MLSALLGEDKARPLKRLIIQKTEGTPFFMEETVQVLFDEVRERNGGGDARKSLNALKIPPTVQGILASRIDRLPPGEGIAANPRRSWPRVYSQTGSV